MHKFDFGKRISFQVRLAAMSMLGLALLNATHWAHGNSAVTNSVFQFLLGIAPNVAAGYAMPLLLASFVLKVVKDENRGEDAYNILIRFLHLQHLVLSCGRLFKSTARIFTLTRMIFSQLLLELCCRIFRICGSLI